MGSRGHGASLIVRSYIFEYINSTSYIMYNFFCVIQSLDIYVLVCKPFQYEYFNPIQTITKFIAFGVGGSVLIASDELLEMLSSVYVLVEWVPSASSFIRQGIDVYRILKWVAIKISCFSATVFMARSIKKTTN